MIFLLLYWILVVPVTVSGGFFCAQFRPVFSAKVRETAKPGTIAANTLAPKDNTSSMTIENGDTDYIHYDGVSGNIVIRKPVHDFRGQTLRITGLCSEYISALNYNIELEGIIQVRVEDVNDPPVFLNLPETIFVEESTPARSVVYVAAASNPTDVDPYFDTEMFQIINVTGKNRNEALDAVFMTDRLGRIRVITDLDYEHGLREYHVLVQVRDAGTPSLSAMAYLNIFINDSDDQSPKFHDKVYTASVIGDKPVSVEDCQFTSPRIYAEDQDPVKKSSVRYNIREGVPLEPWHWQNFFFLKAGTGELCQREAIPRIIPKRGDQTVPDNFEGFKNYTLTIESYQTDDRSKFDTATLYVHVIDQNIHTPTFTRRRYKAEVDEYPAVRAGTVVVTVRAQDTDYGRNNLFEYKLLDNPSGAFWIDSASGEIKVTRPRGIDREKNDTIIFKVRASEISTKEKRYSDSIVDIKVLDDNDNNPKFRKSAYKFTVKDSLDVGMPVHPFSQRLSAADPDLAENGTIRFSILSVQTKGGSFSMKDTQRFKIGEESGILHLADSLRDLRRMKKFPQYIIMVKAEDQSLNPRKRRSAVTRVILQIAEANDFPPYFENTNTDSYISEDASVGWLITKLKARDEDGDEDIFLKFRIVSGNQHNDFRVSDKGYLFTNRPLDRETRDTYKLTVETSDGLHTARTNVTIHVRDTNDHSPVFSKQSYIFSLSEDARANEKVGKVDVRDDDEGPNGKVVYSLLGEHSELFHIKPSGEIFLKKRNGVIDREKTERITLQVRAEDLGQPPKQGEATVRVQLEDVNDNKPVFSKSRYITVITEEAPGRNRKNAAVSMEDDIVAEDDDKNEENRNIIYSLRGPGSDVFDINKKTGQLFIRETKKVDCEVKCDYKMKIIGRDRGGTGLEGSADLHIKISDINDNKPQFVKNYVFNVSPQTKVGSVIGNIRATDRDKDPRNNRVMFILRDGGAGRFRIDFDSGRLILVDSLTRRPQIGVYNLSVEIMDSGEPRLSTKGVVRVVTPINPEPTFPVGQNFAVREDTVPGSEVGQVQVTDTGDLNYKVDSTDPVPFRVTNMGHILTTSKLDRETIGEYSLKIVVTDKGYPVNTVTGTITIHVVDVNDEAPTFEFRRYSGEIKEDDMNPIPDQVVVMPGPIIVKDADATKDNREVILSLSGHGSDLVTIDSKTGIVSVKTPGSIDCEKKCLYALKVHARDRKGTGLRGKADLIINVRDVNDNKPVFADQLLFDVDSMTKPGSLIGSALAVDGDKKPPNNAVLHVLVAGGHGKFEVDLYTGDITLKSSLVEEPRVERYELHIKAFDFGNPSLSTNTTAIVTVKLNFPPNLGRDTHFSIKENASIGTIVGKVEATDTNIERGDDDELKFYIDEVTLADSKFPFTIARKSGKITTQNVLDSEFLDEYHFPVYVIDSMKPVYTSSTTVHIKIEDENDSPPRFTAPEYALSVWEDNGGVTPHQELKIFPDIAVTDTDSALGDIRYTLQGNGSELFSMDPKHGNIELAYSGKLDSEKQEQYKLQIVASDGKFSSVAPLTVTVKDVNDNPPVFQEKVTLNISSLTPEGTLIGQLITTDADVTEANRNVMYYVSKGGMDRISIHPATGKLQIVSSLLEEPLREKYVLKVRALNLGFPQKYSDTSVTVYVDVNHRPVLPAITELVAEEDTPVGGSVGTIKVSDRNVERKDGDKLHFSLSKEVTEVPFAIDENTGVLRTISQLDREKHDAYSFVVEVHDSKQPTYTSSTTVKIAVKDVNDHVPKFLSSSYVASLFEDDTQPDTPQTVYLKPPMQVTDFDSKDLLYSLDGDGSEVFTIDIKTGKIVQKEAGSLDAERQAQYNLTVSVSDGEYASNVTLTIIIEDVNEHSPVVTGLKSFRVDPLAMPGSDVAEVIAQDQDVSLRNRKLSYFLLSGSKDRFTIDEDTGKIRVKSPLTQGELIDSYNLEIKIVDHGYPQKSTDETITLNVPVNFPPTLDDEYRFTLDEEAIMGYWIGEITASDRNVMKGHGDRLHYFISEEESGQVPFVVNYETGKIRTIGIVDRESQEEFKFKVFVTDSLKPVQTASTTVTVTLLDINDNPPTFGAPSYSAVIPENLNVSVDNSVTVIPKISVFDPDTDSDIVYSLFGPGSQLFDIDSSGMVSVKEGVVLDAETQHLYNITIKAADYHLFATAFLEVTVEDVNDNPPIFQDNMTIHLDPFVSPGTVVFSVSATDADLKPENNGVRYLLISGRLDKFQINEETGDVTLLSSLMDEPKQSEYKLKVRAYDTGSPQLKADGFIHIHVPVNYEPEFPPSYRFSVKEDMTVGTEVGKVEAVDKNIERGEDDALTYFIDERSTQGVDFPFLIQEGTGRLVLSCVLDREKKDTYNFQVFVTDQKDPVYTASTLVTVDIEDVNDNPPLFSAPAYKDTVHEDDKSPAEQQTLSVVPTLSAEDMDSSGQPLTFSLSGQGSELFVIDSHTGIIQQRDAGNLDSDVMDKYNLTVTVSDGKYNSSSDLFIAVVDKNDNPPRIVSSEDLVVLPKTDVGSVIGKVLAVDEDTSPRNSHLAYFLEKGGMDRIRIDPTNGEIILEESLLGLPYKDFYELRVRVVDFGHPQLSENTVIKVKVPLNKAPIVPPETLITVPEDTAVGSSIGKIMATDQDSNTTLHLQFTLPDKDIPFDIDARGNIKLNSKLDSERRDSYKFPIAVVDIGTPTFTITGSVVVNVDGVNDERPVFSSTMYTAAVDERLSLEDAHKPILITPELSVTDGDSVGGNDVVLTLEGTGSNLFTIDSITHHLFVQDHTLVDCEVMCEYNLQVIATDEGGEGLQSSANLTITVIDVNDNAPVFIQTYNFSINPDASIGTLVGVVDAFDLDGWEGNNRVTYVLTQGGAGKFHVLPESGEIIVSDSLIRAPIEDVYKLQVQARDSGFPVLYDNTEVIVEVLNNKAPVVSESVTLKVDESAPVDSYIGTLNASDPDSSAMFPVVFSLLDEQDTFDIDPISGRITIITALDAEQEDIYKIRVQIEDPGVPTHVLTSTVTVNVADVNDNHPKFSSPEGYRAEIFENDDTTSPLNLVPGLTVTDEDKHTTELVYELEGPNSEHFEMDPSLGTITMSPDVDIDCERVCQYDFQIIVTDEDGEGLSSKAPLRVHVIDVNDNSPDITTDVEYYVQPNASIGHVVGKVVAVDLDNDTQNHQLTYILTKGGFGKFSVDFDTGVIHVADDLTRAPLLNEYPLTFVVRDSGFPSLSSKAVYTVVVPINRAPVVLPVVDVQVVEDVAVGHVIADLSVDDPHDLDEAISDIVYNLDGSRGLFEIDSNTGLVRTIAKLDADNIPTVDMTATIVDHGIPSYTGTTAIHVDIEGVNDNIPTFSSPTGYTATVPEDVGLKSSHPVDLVLTPGLTIDDKDGDDVFVSLSGNGSELFAINQENFAVTVQTPERIDCEEQCSYKLLILATDSGTPEQSSYAELFIQVKDVNEHAPEFAMTYVFPVPVDASVGTVVGSVEATDKDNSPQNNQVFYNLKSGAYDKFDVGTLSGEITVADSLIREPQLAEYQLQIEARDQGYPSKSAVTTVSIKVPLNQKPELPHTLVYNVSEDLQVGEIVATVMAQDSDLLDVKGQHLQFSVVGGDGVFTMDRNTADLILFDDLDAEVKNVYNLQVNVADNGYPSLTSTATMIVNVLDVNDNPPVFSSLTGYVARISEAADVMVTPIIEVVPELSALNGDVSGSKDDIRFELDGTGSEDFAIDPVTAELRTAANATLDADVQDFYYLTVIATDDFGTGQQTSTSLNITIEDRNDNPPVFRETYHGMQTPITIDPAATVGTVVYTLEAVDNDVDDANSRVTYLLTGGGLGKFQIDHVAGQVKVADDLTREPLEKNYQLEVKALDSGTPQLSTETVLYFNVPLNTKPEFQKDIHLSVPENISIGDTVGVIALKDFDGQTEGFEFFLESSVSEFVLDSQRGELRTVKQLDAELRHEYLLPITVIDHGIPVHTVSTTATVAITDIDDNLPLFTASLGYSASLQEGDVGELREVELSPGLTVMDADVTSGNSEYRVYVKGPGSKLFEISRDGTSLLVKDSSLLDAEKHPMYELQLIAESVNNKDHWSSRNLTISVRDRNDHAPVLPRELVYTADPASVVGTVLGRIQANDSDMDRPNNEVMYIMPEDGHGKFGIGTDSGEIYVKNALTLEPVLDYYELLVEAIDKGYPALTGSTTVVVHVPISEPLNVPRSVMMTVTEGSDVGMEVGRIQLKTSENPEHKIKFKLLDTNVPFKIDDREGIVYSRGELDAEVRDRYNLEVIVVKTGAPSYTATTTVTVMVDNVNDNPPKFKSERGYTATVTEHQTERFLNVFPEIAVIDVDTKGGILDVRYSLDGNGSVAFSIDPVSATLQLRNPLAIDAEQVAVYNLSILATDDNGTGLTSRANLRVVVKDVNDNPPRFDYIHNVKVDPNSPAGFKVATVSAVDEDQSVNNNRLLYFIDDGYGKFVIEPLSGVIRLSSMLTKEPRRNRYELSVKAVDSGQPPLTTNTTVFVSVDLNQPPMYSTHQSFSVHENQPAGTTIGYINVTDPENGELRFSTKDASAPVTVNESSGLLMMSSPLDREQMSEVKLPVQIVDIGAPSFTGTVTVTVNIIDVNDNKPTFNVADGYHAVVSEVFNTFGPQTVYLNTPIKVTDADSDSGEIKLNVTGEGSELFGIDVPSGHVILFKPELIDSERKSVYNLEITASDEMFTTSVPLFIDVDDFNDNPPEFEGDYTFQVSTNTPVGAEIGQISAVDRDTSERNSKITYILKAGGYGKFEVDSETGSVTLADDILREPVLAQYDMHVLALDNGQERLFGETYLTVQVPVNSKPTVKDRFIFTVQENMVAGTVLGAITIDDPDLVTNPYETMEFSVTDTRVPVAFKDRSGILTTRRSFDREKEEYIVVPITIVNPGAPAHTISTTATVMIQDVNDNIPTFNNPAGYTARITENVYTEYLDMIEVISVTDADVSEHNQLYELYISGPGSDKFSIDKVSGRMRLKRPGSLDAEEYSSYNITLTARDKFNMSSNAPLLILVEDVNDNPPVLPASYNLSVAAGTKVGQTVSRIRAQDDDVQRKNNRITYLLRGGAFGKFDLDPNTGEIIVSEDLTVEPFRHVYRLSVEAIDSGDPRLSSESVVVVSVNLNKPPDVPKVAQFIVKENQTIGSVVGKVNVSDPDMKFNPSERVEFFTGEPKAPFTVERLTGVIRMAAILDREKNDHFELPVIVMNEGSPSYTSTTHVTVSVQDLNDNAPVFSAPVYTGHIVEDGHGLPAATTVQLDRKITVHDDDVTDVNQRVVLNLTGHGSDVFHVDSEAGDLQVRKHAEIDCEVTCQYNLTVYATDQDGHGLTSAVNVTILVEDLNDNSPIFVDDYEYTVHSGVDIGTAIGTVKASDRDKTSKNNMITYLVLEGGHGKFDVDPVTGELRVSDSLKREPFQEMFNLTIMAVDNGFPRRSSSTTVKIHVPMNKAPSVDHTTSMTMEENLPLGSMVGKIKAVDPDANTTAHEPLEFQIPDVSVPFEVDRYSGELKLKSSVDREKLGNVTFNVQVVNDGAPSYTVSTLVTVLVNDSNDHPPEFANKGGYSGIVWEPAKPRKRTGYVKLNQPIIVEDDDETEANRNVKVTLSGDESDMFEYKPKSGHLLIKDMSLVDAEKRLTYTLKLTATDQGGNGLSTSTKLDITVKDINDNSPEFVGNTSFILNPDSEEDTVVGVIRARDADATPQNNRVTYLLKSGGYGKFGVDSNTGEIRVVDTLLREPVMDKYYLEVKIQDNGVPQRSSETVVTIGVPVNHPPRMSRDVYEFHLAENNLVGDVVGRVIATDPDIPADPHHELTYSAYNTEGRFSIESDTGIVHADIVFDRESIADAEFDVQVKDNVYPEYRDTAKVKVNILDINDNPPELIGGPEFHGTIQEEDKRNRIVKLDKNFTVVDRDATEEHRHFTVNLEGYASKFFSLDDGVIKAKRPIDREFHDDFQMQIVARDRDFSWLSSTAQLKIDVTDINDNFPEFLEPTFTFTLPSVVGEGDVAGKVVALDVDATEPNNKIIYLLKENPLGKFKVDINTGDVILLPSFFSKPRNDAYSLTVEARDMGYPSKKSEADVIVRAPYFDYNDYPPDFKGDTMFVTREEVPIGAVVGRLNVVDADNEGESNARLELLSDKRVPFTIQPDGSITCSDRIDRDLGPNYYKFKVRATDSGTPPYNVTRDVSVIVDDVNDNPPKFSLPRYKHMVSDSFPSRTVIATPFAFDSVDEKDSVYRYQMRGGPSGYFHIDDKTGVVMTTDMASTLDPQTMSYEIEAVDLYNRDLKATTALDIQVIESSKPSNITCK